MDLNKIGVVILAAGKGSRLNCVDTPKVMCEIGGKPIVSYVIEKLLKIGFKKKDICFVVGFKKDKVINHFGDEYVYAHQEEQLGTGHAAFVGMKALPKDVEHVLVLNGDDSAFYTENSLKNLIKSHLQGDYTVSLLTVKLSDPSSYGRIMREDDSFRIVEKELLTKAQKEIEEISTGTFVLDRYWYEKIFPDMPKMEGLDEYGLPTAISIARKQNKSIQAIKLENNKEWFGINRPHELERADILKKTGK